ncbi:MAG: trypsin-like peptidase domain-containing protein [Anaerolineales bacterium]|nr:trypsin-like peptidase domain-containing protein [Anaerolineales bacterium]
MKRKLNPILVLSLLALLALILAACAAAAEPTAEEAEMEEMEAPVEEEEAAAEEEPMEEAEIVVPEGGQPQGTLYGEDNRLDICVGDEFDANEPGQDCAGSAFIQDDTLLAMSSSVAMLVRPAALQTGSDGVVTLNAFTLNERVERVYGAPLCSAQRFADQLAPGFCTGFLIDDQLLLTSAHCIPSAAACENTRFVFGYQMNMAGEAGTLTDNNVYACDSLEAIVQDQTTLMDYALVRLDRPTGLPGLVLTEEAAAFDEELASLGHPSGLPMKIATGAWVLEADAEKPYFVASLDVFAGSSGSPVIDMQTYTVKGMLMGGEEDYVLTKEGCYAVKVCDLEGNDCTGEAALKVTHILADLREFLPIGTPIPTP